MLATTTVEAAVRALVGARREQRPAPAAAPTLPDVEAAYAVQAAVGRALGWFKDEPADCAPRHWKSGAPSRGALQTHAPLPPAGVWPSPADARAWPCRLRGIEAEIALRLGRDVDAARAANLDPAGAMALIDAMCVSIELVDSRWREGMDAPALAKLADLQSHGALVLGEWQTFSPRDWAEQHCHVRIGTRPGLTFQGTHSMGDPALVLVAWLRHATQGGRRVRAGTVVTTGTWCGLPQAAPGDRVLAEFPGIGQAEVRL